MAIVPDLAGVPMNLGGRGVDRKLSAPNRNVTGNPIGVTAPGYTGEQVCDTSTGQIWVATNLTNTGWAPITLVM